MLPTKVILVLLFLAGASSLPNQCVGQNKSRIPTPDLLKDRTDAVRDSQWFPKRTSNQSQKAADAIAILERADAEPDAATKYAILNEALLLSDQSQQWSLSREILKDIQTHFVLQPDQLAQWYENAIRRKQPLARISELIQLFSSDVKEHDLPVKIKSWQSNAKQLSRKINKTKPH